MQAKHKIIRLGFIATDLAQYPFTQIVLLMSLHGGGFLVLSTASGINLGEAFMSIVLKGYLS